jgi:DNA-binding response OmpR family regulator
MKKNRVLVVDDVRVIRFALRNYLEHAGFVVTEAEDCRSAREVMQREPPDAVVLDHDLPDGLSYDLIGDLLACNPKVAIVVLTAHGTQKVHDEVLRLGAKRLLLKPVDLSILKDVIASLLL